MSPARKKHKTKKKTVCRDVRTPPPPPNLTQTKPPPPPALLAPEQDGDGETDQDDDIDGGNPSAGASGPGPPDIGRFHSQRFGGGAGGDSGLKLQEQQQDRGEGSTGAAVPEPKARLEKVKPEAKEVGGARFLGEAGACVRVVGGGCLLCVASVVFRLHVSVVPSGSRQPPA